MAIVVVYPKSGDVLSNVLDRELRDIAGIPIIDVSWLDGFVEVKYEDTATPAQMAQGEAIVAAHVPVDSWQVVAASAEGAILAIPGWARWTEAEALAWGQTNIEQPLAQARTDLNALATLNLATFKTVIGRLLDILDAMWTLQRSLGRLVIALRNRTLPHLQD